MAQVQAQLDRTLRDLEQRGETIKWLEAQVWGTSCEGTEANTRIFLMELRQIWTASYILRYSMLLALIYLHAHTACLIHVHTLSFIHIRVYTRYRSPQPVRRLDPRSAT